MTTYSTTTDAMGDFLYFKNKYDRVCNNFVALFEDFNPERLHLDAIKANLDRDQHTFEVEILDRKFAAEMSAVTKGSDVVGHVEFVETFGPSRRVVDAFQVSSKGEVLDLSGKVLMPVQNYSSEQNLFILNLIYLGLTKPIQRSAP